MILISSSLWRAKCCISRGEPNVNPPFGFNRIITPQIYHDPTINSLSVKYVLSLTQIEDEGYEKVFEENETKIYRNKEHIEKYTL